MSGARFGVLLGLAAVATAAAAFLVGLQVLDDDRPDRAPAVGPAGPAADSPDEEGPGSDGAASPPEPAAITDGELPSPSWVVVVSSEGDQARAQAVAREVAERGHPAGLLRSEDYPSLNPGFWVAYAGPYPDATAAARAERAVEADGWPAAYVRCAGTRADCGSDEPADPAPDDEG